MMLNVSEKATAALLENLETNRTEESQLLRLIHMTQGFAMTLDKERDGDQVVEHDNRKVLVVRKDISEGLEGVTLDAEDTPEGTQLVFQPSQGT